jgi:hypothetical protein
MEQQGGIMGARVLQVLVLLALLAGVAEAYARFGLGQKPAPLADDSTLAETFAKFVEPDPQLGFRYRPNVDQLVTAPSGGFEILFKTNEIGLRDRPMGTHLRNELKFLVFGDEFTESWGTDIDEAAVVNAQRLLNEMTALAPPVRLVIGGKSGYGAAQNLAMARQLVEQLKPQAIVFMYSSLMPHADRLFSRAGAGGGSHLVPHADDRPRYADTPWAPFAAYSALARLLGEKSAARAMAAKHVPGDAAHDRFAGIRGDDASLREAHAATLESVQALAALARERGIHFMLVHLPLAPQVAADEWPEGRAWFGLPDDRLPAPDAAIVSEFCARAGLRCHALHELLATAAAAPDSLPLYHRHEIALTVAGNRVVGDWLAKTLHDWMGELALR